MPDECVGGGKRGDIADVPITVEQRQRPASVDHPRLARDNAVEREVQRLRFDSIAAFPLRQSEQRERVGRWNHRNDVFRGSCRLAPFSLCRLESRPYEDQPPVARRVAQRLLDDRRGSAKVAVAQFQVSEPQPEPGSLFDGQVRPVDCIFTSRPQDAACFTGLPRELSPPRKTWCDSKVRSAFAHRAELADRLLVIANLHQRFGQQRPIRRLRLSLHKIERHIVGLGETMPRQ